MMPDNRYVCVSRRTASCCCRRWTARWLVSPVQIEKWKHGVDLSNDIHLDAAWIGRGGGD